MNKAAFLRGAALSLVDLTAAGLGFVAAFGLAALGFFGAKMGVAGGNGPLWWVAEDA